MKIATVLTVTTVLFASPYTVAQGFTLSDFSDVSSLTLLGSATQSGTVLRLTDTVIEETGNAWHNVPQGVLAGFDTQFEFSITPGQVTAEGFAFVLQSSPAGSSAQGGSRWGLGYGVGLSNSAIANSLAIEVDMFAEGFLADTGRNEISIHTAGSGANDESEGASIARATHAANLDDGAIHTMRVLHDGAGALNVYIDDLQNPVLSANYDFLTGGTLLAGPSVGGLNLPTGAAFVGFGASTGIGSLSERVELHSWTWNSTSGVDPCFDGTVGVGGGGAPASVLKINGSAGDFFRKVQVAAFDPFTIDVAAPPGQTTGRVLLFGELGAADGSNAVTFPAGTFCFAPVAAIQLMAGPVPFSFPVSTGLPFVAQITLQGVMAVDLTNPSALAITNTVILNLVPAPSPVITDVTPASAPAGTPTVITGSGFSPGARLSVSGVPTTPTSITATTITFPFPAVANCDSAVIVTNPDGQSASDAINPSPVVTNPVNPTGSAAGGLNFTVLGRNFAPPTTVMFGATAATLVVNTDTVLVITTPPGAPGVVSVSITNAGGCATSTPYTYQ